MATIILDYDKRNVQAKRALDNILAMGFFKLRTIEKPCKRTDLFTEEQDGEFLYSMSEQVLAKDWLNKFEDEAWENL